jgi:hypothetical protein
MMQKLAELKGAEIISYLKVSLELFASLSNYIQDFNFVINELNLDCLAEEYLDFAIELCK